MNAWTLAVDGWIITIGALGALACAVPGAFLVVRRTSMLADAVSHAVLPGIAVAFLLSGTRDPLWMFLGAAAAGLFVTLGSSALARIARIDSGAALGIVFTTMFALGLILIVQVADRVDLDPSCVLYGAIELAPLDSILLLGVEVPRAVLVLGGVTLLNAFVAVIFWKELTVMAFDPALARTLGCRPKLMESIILGMAAATCVAAFESVGSILIVAMMIIPAASARLWSDRLAGVIVGAMLIGILGALVGHWIATAVAPAIIPGGRDASSAGSIAATLGALLVASIVVAPRRGIVVRLVHRWLLTLRIAREDAIGLLWRLDEDQRTVAPAQLRDLLVRGAEIPNWLARMAIAHLVRDGRLECVENVARLTTQGRADGASLVRSHRLWEIYLMQRLAIAKDHVHPTAMVLEHITDAVMREQLAREGGIAADDHGTRADPHGRAVPEVPRTNGAN